MPRASIRSCRVWLSVLSGSRLRGRTERLWVTLLVRHESVMMTSRVKRVSHKHALYIYAKRFSAIPRAGGVAIRGAGIRSVKRCDGGVRRMAHEAVIHTARVRIKSRDHSQKVDALRVCPLTGAERVAIRRAGTRSVNRREGAFGVRGITHEAVIDAARVRIKSRDHSKKVDAVRICPLTGAGRVAIRGAGTRSVKRREGGFGVRGITQEAVSYAVLIKVVSRDTAEVIQREGIYLGS
jgi:hypothetical protein